MTGPGMPRARVGPGARALHLARLLDLTDAQRTQVERIVEDTRRANWALVGQLMSERFAMRGLLRAEKLEPDAIVDQQRRIDGMRLQLLKARLEARNRIQGLLTPEQQERFRSLPIRGLS